MNDNLLQLTPQDDQPNIDPNKNYFAELVGENKKFKTPEELAKGKEYADQYIKILEKRQDDLRQEYLKLREDNTSKANLAEIAEQLKQRLASSEEPEAKEEIKPQLDPQTIESLVSKKIQEHDVTKKQQENFNMVKGKLQERYGNNYQNVLKQQIEDLGLTEEFVNDLAKKHPTVLFKTLGLDQQQNQDSFLAPPRSNQRGDSFAPSAPKKRTWSYYQELKKSNPTLYFDRKTAVQMQNDAIELGAAFQDGDYFVKGLHEQ